MRPKTAAINKIVRVEECACDPALPGLARSADERGYENERRGSGRVVDNTSVIRFCPVCHQPTMIGSVISSTSSQLFIAPTALPPSARRSTRTGKCCGWERTRSAHDRRAQRRCARFAPRYSFCSRHPVPIGESTRAPVLASCLRRRSAGTTSPITQNGTLAGSYAVGATEASEHRRPPWLPS